MRPGRLPSSRRKKPPLQFPLQSPTIRLFLKGPKTKVSRAVSTKRRRSDSNRCIKVLQTSPLPLGYGATENLLIISAVEPRIAQITRLRPAEDQADRLLVGSSVRFQEVGRFLCRLQSGNFFPAGTNTSRPQQTFLYQASAGLSSPLLYKSGLSVNWWRKNVSSPRHSSQP